MREHSTPEKECLQRIADIAVGYDGNADANCEQGSMKGLCGMIDEMKELARKGLSGEWPDGGQVKLSELEPRFASDSEGRRWITFDCPKCREHKIAVQIAGEGKFIWQMSGPLETLTLSPSVAWAPKGPGVATIWTPECEFHFFVRNGAIESLNS